MNEFIIIENMYCSIGHVSILKNINLTLEKNQFVSIIGPNGSGKTTLGKVITGMITYDSGNVLIDNKNINSLILPQIGRKIGYLFQNPDRQIFAPTVYEELSFALKYKKIHEDIIEEEVSKMLEIFDLKHLKNSTTYFLSQGEKQRLAIGAILLNKPEYLILDEPTTGLDIVRKKNLSDLLLKIRNQLGILMISHDKNFINDHSERIIELKNGCIINDKKC